MDKPKLHVITASTRPGRKGKAVAQWFVTQADAHAAYQVREVDLVEVALPIYDEPKHPRLGEYEHEHTKRWSATVREADAFVIVLPEYNFGVPPALLNAFDYLSKEWAYAPMGIVSYGGVSAGLRSAQMAKLTITSLKMMPMVEAVSIPFIDKAFQPDGHFDPGAVQQKAASIMLDELLKWTTALRPLRRANLGG